MSIADSTTAPHGGAASASAPSDRLSGPATDEFPGLPPLVSLECGPAPAAPENLQATGIDASHLTGLALKLASTTPQFATEWAAERLCLPLQLTEEILWQLKQDKLIEILAQNGPFSYRYAVTERGREHAVRLMEICGYVGPAPVSLAAYSAMLKWQVAGRSPIAMESVRTALSPLVLLDEAVEVAALAASSGRSLFLFGPPGNGKTSVGRLLHSVQNGEMWVPHCLQIENDIIRLLDPQCHEVVPVDGSQTGRIDRRWVRVRRPFIVAGGEMTMDELDLSYSPTLRFYEAPHHVKANGGVFLIDDFGRQRIDPHELLNRWIIPLEHRVDFLTLGAGRKIQLPFELLLIVATNLKVAEVADPAFLRRMGYRLNLESPSPQRYTEIFERYARKSGMAAPPGLVERLLKRYQSEGRELRCSEPRDLIDRAGDICRLRGRPLALDSDILDAAWRGYFGNSD